MTELIDRLREDLDRVVADTPAPTAAELVRAASERGRRIRRRRRTGVTLLAAASVAAVVLPLAGRSGGGQTRPAPAPATSTSPSVVAPTPSATVSRAARPEWRVTQRCKPRLRDVCSRLDAVAIEVDGVEYWNAFGGEQPLDQQDRSIELSVGNEQRAFRVLGGVVSRTGTYVSFSLYVDGRRVAHYDDGRVRLLPVPAGHHEVRLVADGSVHGSGTSIAVAEFLPYQRRE